MNNLNNYVDKTQYCLASMPQLLIGLPTKGLPVPFLVKGSIPGPGWGVCIDGGNQWICQYVSLTLVFPSFSPSLSLPFPMPPPPQSPFHSF